MSKQTMEPIGSTQGTSVQATEQQASMEELGRRKGPNKSGQAEEPQQNKTSTEPNPSAVSELPDLSAIEAAKRLAAYAAVDERLKPHHKVIGIGSGSTIVYVVERILMRGHHLNQSCAFVPTGFQSKELLRRAELTCSEPDVHPQIDITFDGADECDGALNLIKGGGACQLREKVVAECAREFIVVADHRKRSHRLGTSWTQGIPIEVVPFAYPLVISNLRRLGAQNPSLRMGKMKAGPVVTDNNGFVIDAIFPAEVMYPQLVVEAAQGAGKDDGGDGTPRAMSMNISGETAKPRRRSSARSSQRRKESVFSQNIPLSSYAHPSFGQPGERRNSQPSQDQASVSDAVEQLRHIRKMRQPLGMTAIDGRDGAKSGGGGGANRANGDAAVVDSEEESGEEEEELSEHDIVGPMSPTLYIPTLADPPMDDPLRDFSGPEMLLHRIKSLTGVVEVGLFCRMASAAYFGEEDGSVSVRDRERDPKNKSGRIRNKKLSRESAQRALSKDSSQRLRAESESENE